MKTLVKPEHQLTLAADTAGTDSGQYFCNERQFALPRTGNLATPMPHGAAAFEAMHEALMSATKFIWIADWWMAFDVELIKRGDTSHPGRLIKVLEEIIKSRAVQIRVLLYRSPADFLPPYTKDGMVMTRLMEINHRQETPARRGHPAVPAYPGRIEVMLQAQTSSFGFSHHQKFMVVDGRVAFLGGVDFTYGRHGTSEFDVVANPGTRVINEMYSPCQTSLRGVSPREQRLIDDGFAAPYSGTLIEEGCQPVLPWHDVHVRVEGPAVVDVHRNFVRRWNMQIVPTGQVSTAFALMKTQLDAMGATPLLQQARKSKPGSALIQIVRSVSAGHLQTELLASRSRPNDVDYESEANAAVWVDCLKAWQRQPQANILDAMVNCIRSADNYIYMETQFFISQFGEASAVAAGPKSSQAAGITNTLIVELAKRIEHHINAGTNFHVYLLIPVHPEGSIRDDATWKQQWEALQTIAHGSDSLVNRIERSLAAKKRTPDEWNRYLTVLNMRNYGVAVQYARDPKTFDDDFSREIGRYVITEQVYVHSKTMIVDDAVAIVGSANLNERSLSGNGDTELSAVIVDTEDVRYEDLGSPGFKVHTRKFARDLRRRLWEKHFGFAINAAGYFRSTDRVPPSFAVVGIPEHPPRLTTTAGSFLNSQPESSVPWSQVLAKPCDPQVIAAIRSIASTNKKAYEAVFTHIPRNEFKTFQQGLDSFSEPYPCAVAGRAVQAGLRREEGNDRLRRSYPSPESANNRDQSTERLDQVYQSEVKRILDGTLGIIPPPLAEAFMTRTLMPHQKDAHAGSQDPMRRYVTYQGRVHDIKKTIDHLKANVTGFFVLAPLDWAKGVAPSHFNKVSRAVNLAQVESVPNDHKRG